MAGSMRQLEERQLPAEVTIMKWSPKMDLLAIANVKGEISLHRLTLQRVWLLSPLKESDTVVNLAWRPDGKLIAICYEASKLLCLVDIENKNVIYKTQLTVNRTITCTSWLPLCNTDGDSSLNSRNISSPTGEYLPPLPSLNRSFGQEHERKDFLSQNLDMLFIGQDNGTVTMHVFGMFPCGTITVGQGQVLEISGGPEGFIWTTWRDNNGINVNKLSCPLLKTSGAFLKVAQAQANIEYLMDYLSRTLMAISESWETILLEMDEKLARYAENNPPGGVAADFLELLMIGIPSQELENFLLRDLTEKGLKKLGHSIETCNSNIQKLVLKHLSSVGMALVYQLAEMRGMARLGGPYACLGLQEESQITKALHAAEAFLAKSSEIQQVIDLSMRDYKAFFRWLYLVIMRLTDERVPTEVSRVSQQELTFIADFLRGFDKIEPGATGRNGVNLEKLGQYLRREPLQTCLTPEGSEWAAMLDECQCLRDHPLIVKQDLNYSLLQSHSKLVEAVNAVFHEAYRGLVNHFHSLNISLIPSHSFSSSQIVRSDENLLIATSDADRKLLRLFKVLTDQSDPPALKYQLTVVEIDQSRNDSFSKAYAESTIADLQFYSEDYLSLLLLNQQRDSSCLIQLPVDTPRIFQHPHEDQTLSLFEIIGASWPKSFHGISARRLAVSGSRKVAAILSESNRKIRLLETEVEPEDEEDEDEDDETGDDNMMDVTSANVSQ